MHLKRKKSCTDKKSDHETDTVSGDSRLWSKAIGKGSVLLVEDERAALPDISRFLPGQLADQFAVPEETLPAQTLRFQDHRPDLVLFEEQGKRLPLYFFPVYTFLTNFLNPAK